MTIVEDGPYARIQVRELVGERHSSEDSAIVSSDQLQDVELLRKGRHYAQMACATPGWRAASSSRFHSYSFTCFKERIFAYYFPPPVVEPVDENEQPAQSVHIRTWDTSVEAISSLESFVSEELEPFVTTKFDPDERRYRVLTKKLKTRPRESSLSPRPPWKRSKPVVESLFTLVPHPHYIPYPVVTLPAPPIPSPNARPFTPILPHTIDSVQELLNEEFTRLSWIIPIRGSIQPHNLSSASLLEESLPADGTPTEIAWTRPSVSEFWSFLTETIQQGAYGEVSLSFQPVMTSKPPSRQTISTTVPENSSNPSNSTTSASTSTLSSIVTAPDPFHVSLRATDHIKIYCDAQWAMDVRRAIEDWHYACSEVQGEERDIRILRDVKLVLVDGRNSPVLIS